MAFHGDYEEALDNRESRNSPCPYNIRVGDLVKPKARWIDLYASLHKDSVGIITDVYKMTLEQNGRSYWCCKIFIDGALQVGPIVDFELVKRGNKD